MTIATSNIHLPERETSSIISFLEANALPSRVPVNETGAFNCWGFTAYFCEWEKRALWLEGFRMEEHLKTRTTPISKEEAKAGDVAIFRRGDHLTHTAIVLPGGDLVCHKPGITALCIDRLEAAKASYGADVTYARATKNNGVLTSDSESV